MTDDFVLVIATREDPQLPLARLRGGGQLSELRVTDLRFSPSEAAGFLNQAMGLNLSAEDIATLVRVHAATVNTADSIAVAGTPYGSAPPVRALSGSVGNRLT
jgi:hypothetical protein